MNGGKPISAINNNDPQELSCKTATKIEPKDFSWKFYALATVAALAALACVVFAGMQAMRTDIPHMQNAVNDNLNKVAAVDVDLQKVNAQLAANPPADLKPQLLQYKSFLEAEKSALLEKVSCSEQLLHVYSTLPDKLLYAIGPVAAVAAGAGGGAVYFARKDYKAARIV
jgi:hypothetical protein